jgi:bla regulator protein blaR1
MIAEVANHLWQSTLVAGLAWLVTLALRRDRAGVRHAVWLAASLKFLVPFSALTSLGARFGWRPIVVAAFTPHDLLVATGGGVFPEQAIRIAAHPSTSVSTMRSMWNAAPSVLVAVWAIGATALLAMWIVRWRRVSTVAREAAPLTAGPIVDALRAIERRARLTRPIAIAASESSLEPGVFGIITPTLVWPSRLGDHLSPEQIEAILAHEVTHIRRRDNLAAILHLLAHAAFWFHPLVWWIGARLVDERERACDEAVVSSGSERHAYAESILTTCRLFTESPLACVSGVTGADLKKRIEHIMLNDIRSGLTVWKKGLLAVAGCAAIAVPFVIGVMTVKPLLAQQPATDAAFDVTSVKMNNAGSGMIRMLPAANGGWQAENVPLGMLVRLAFQLQDNQIVGGPKWLFDDRFDVKGTGVAPGRDGPLFDKLKSMLKDRFKLVTHVETREQSIFALVLARSDGKLGEKLTPSTTDCTPTGPNGRGRGQQAPPAPGERPKCGFMIGPGRIMVGGQTMSSFAQTLSRFAGGIVVDKTNLSGTYDAELSYAPDSGGNFLGFGRDLPPQPGPPPVANSDAPSIFAAVQEQLGLKLEATKAPVDVLVIDSAEKPTPD